MTSADEGRVRGVPRVYWLIGQAISARSLLYKCAKGKKEPETTNNDAVFVGEEPEAMAGAVGIFRPAQPNLGDSAARADACLISSGPTLRVTLAVLNDS